MSTPVLDDRPVRATDRPRRRTTWLVAGRGGRGRRRASRPAPRGGQQPRPGSTAPATSPRRSARRYRAVVLDAPGWTVEPRQRRRASGEITYVKGDQTFEITWYPADELRRLRRGPRATSSSRGRRRADRGARPAARRCGPTTSRRPHRDPRGRERPLDRAPRHGVDRGRLPRPARRSCAWSTRRTSTATLPDAFVDQGTERPAAAERDPRRHRGRRPARLPARSTASFQLRTGRRSDRYQFGAEVARAVRLRLARVVRVRDDPRAVRTRAAEAVQRARHRRRAGRSCQEMNSEGRLPRGWSGSTPTRWLRARCPRGTGRARLLTSRRDRCGVPPQRPHRHRQRERDADQPGEQREPQAGVGVASRARRR